MRMILNELRGTYDSKKRGGVTCSPVEICIRGYSFLLE